MSDPITLVCGFGRCGSSLVMQMLEAGGMPAVGEYPAFEDWHAMDDPIDANWLRQCEGKAVKVLDPHHWRPAKDLLYRVIWLDRDPVQQGKSQAKFLRMITGIPAGRAEAKAFAASYRADRPKCMALFNALQASILPLTFEQILTDPLGSAARISEFVGGDLDIRAMAAAVVPREAKCAPGLDMELFLIAAREGEEQARIGQI